ncbi:hypothetical protein ETAA8_47390 [Anatilimnocola aggregata]|uniref:Uncharacterized protein n=1 Tax=Anatilimnocola aggregata TaxID=2528021 RepID=A0A517YHC7_9BACT|nr:hypothetical protein [Anatilimnocola aggregata]QDU29624.1 hypothetical protein ETAA8_47390 [Anatilimnocola aggregata]
MSKLPPLASVLVLAIFVANSYAAEPVRSGLQAGEKITAIFEPLNVNGEHAGERHCLVCENGVSPVAMVFARQPSEALWKLLAELETTTANSDALAMGSFVVFLNEDDKLKEQLAASAKKHSLKKLIVSTYEVAGPEGFEVAKDAEVTVVLYRDFKVEANHAFRAGELTAAAVDKVVADLPKILVKKE